MVKHRVTVVYYQIKTQMLSLFSMTVLSNERNKSYKPENVN